MCCNALGNCQYRCRRVTKVVYKEKNVNGRAVFPSSAVVVVTRGRSETISILVPNAFLTFLEKILRLQKHYYSSAKWIFEATTTFDGHRRAAARSSFSKSEAKHLGKHSSREKQDGRGTSTIIYIYIYIDIIRFNNNNALQLLLPELICKVFLDMWPCTIKEL